MSTSSIPGADHAHGGLRLAVIDTDSGFLTVLAKRCERLGWEQRVLASAVPVDDLVAMRIGALVVDLAVLGAQAWTYLEEVAERLPGVGVVVCTGRSSVAQRVRGLRSGADDWVTKPCHPEELVARVESVVRRHRQGEPKGVDGPVLAGELEIRADRFQAFAGGRSVELTKREFELIALLSAAEGRVLEREEIYQRVWGYAMARGDRSVDVFVRKLRNKLEKSSPEWRYIHTHFGVGYRFSAEAVGVEHAGVPGEVAPIRRDRVREAAEVAADATRPSAPDEAFAPVAAVRAAG